MHALGIYKRFNRRRQQFVWPSFVVDEETLKRHIYVAGKSGTGKSTFLLNSALQHIQQGRGCILIDPKGQTAVDFLLHIPPNRRHDVIYFDPSDLEFPVGYNPIQHVSPRFRSRVASSVLGAFHHLHKDSWGPELANILKNALLAVLCMPGGSLLDVKFMLTSSEHRARITERITDNSVLKRYWEDDFEAMSEKEQRDKTPSTLNKIGPFLTDPMLLNVVSQPSAFDFQDIMDTGKIFVANLAQGQLGENSRLLGGLLITSIHNAALTREKRTLFPIYVDEWQLFGEAVFPDMLSILRDFGISLTLANQYIGQLDEKLRNAVLGAVGNLVVFQIGPEDEGILAPLFELTREDDKLTQIKPFTAYVRTPRETRLLHMPSVAVKRYPANIRKIRNRTRQEFATLRSRVEKNIEFFIAGV